jgi:Lower baseplate protein N-terminal domain
MAIYRGDGGSLDGLVESEVILIAISQGGTGSATASGARTNLGLGTAATTSASDYATAAQGAKADTAIQSADLATVATTGDYDDLSNKPTVPTNLDSLTDVVITSATNGQGLQFNGTNWVNSNAGSGTVTSVDMSVPTGLAVSGNPVTTSGTLAVTYATGYAIPTTAKQTEWDTAYTDRLKWDGGSTGLNASTGRTSLGLGTAATTAATDYATAAQGAKADSALQSYTETDPVYVASSWYGTTNNSTNWNTAYTDRLKWDGGATGLTASTGRTSLGATTVGGNLFTLTDPSAVTFVRLNADNTVSALSASDFRTAIGAGTSSTTGTVTSVDMSVPTGLSVSGNPVTSSGTLAVTFSAGYSIPTTTKQTNWDTAYGWGNHATAGYALDSAVVKLTGDQTIAGTKTFSSTITGSISGNAGTVTNGVVTTGTYSDPTWISTLAGSKITGTIDGGTY